MLYKTTVAKVILFHIFLPKQYYRMVNAPSVRKYMEKIMGDASTSNLLVAMHCFLIVRIYWVMASSYFSSRQTHHLQSKQKPCFELLTKKLQRGCQNIVRTLDGLLYRRCQFVGNASFADVS